MCLMTQESVSKNKDITNLTLQSKRKKMYFYEFVVHSLFGRCCHTLTQNACDHFQGDRENNQACVSGSCNDPADVILRPLSFTAQNGAGNKCPIIISRWYTHTQSAGMRWLCLCGDFVICCAKLCFILTTMNKQSDSQMQAQS